MVRPWLWVVIGMGLACAGADAQTKLYGYEQKPLPLPAGASVERFNNQGVVAGVKIPEYRPFYWRPGEGYVDIIQALGSNPFGTFARTTALNDQNQLLIHDGIGRSWLFDVDTKVLQPIHGAGLDATHAVCQGKGTCFLATEITNAGTIYGYQTNVYTSPGVFHTPTGPIQLAGVGWVEHPMPAGYSWHGGQVFANDAGWITTTASAALSSPDDTVVIAPGGSAVVVPLPSHVGSMPRGITEGGNLVIRWNEPCVPLGYCQATGIWRYGQLSILPGWPHEWALDHAFPGNALSANDELTGRLQLLPPNAGIAPWFYAQLIVTGGFAVRLAALAADPTNIDAIGWLGAVNDQGDVVATGPPYRLLERRSDRVLALHVDPIRMAATLDGTRKIAAGSSLTLTTLGGDSAHPAAVYVMSPQGAFLFAVDIGPLDVVGTRQLSFLVPPAVIGFSVTLRAVSLTTQGTVITSYPRTIQFD